MDLSVIIVSWNVRERLRECLQSITESVRDTGCSFEVFVVDNASSDESAQMVREVFPNVHLIANAENRGFATACNQAVVQSTGEFVLLLNPDMRCLTAQEIAKIDAMRSAGASSEPSRTRGYGEGAAQRSASPEGPHARETSSARSQGEGTARDLRGSRGTLEGIVAFMRERRNARVGIAGCHLLDAQDATVPHVRRFPTLADQLAVVLKLPHLFPRILDRYLIRDFDDAKEARVDSIRGSFFCIRREVIGRRPREIDAMRSAGASSKPSRTREYGEGAAQRSASPEGSLAREAGSAGSQGEGTARDFPRSIGLLDEGFFIWFEEVDYCYRARAAGWQVAYTPSVQCVDYVGQSFRQVALHRKQRLVAASMRRYFRKHRPFWEWAVLTLAWQPVLAVAWLHDTFMLRRRAAGKT